jgi:hypothetical protein
VRESARFSAVEPARGFFGVTSVDAKSRWCHKL